MVEERSRRSVLRAVGVTGATALAGCSWNNPDVSGGHLFVENFLPEDYQTAISVAQGRSQDGEEVVEGYYRIPSDHAIQFGEILEGGAAHTITAYTRGSSPEDRTTVTVPACGSEDATRDVSVRVREDGTGIIPWECNQEYDRRELEYVDASEYRIGTPTEVTAANETTGNGS